MVIIFDFDGTLINSVPDLANSIDFMLQHFNKERAGVEKVTNWVGNGAIKLVERACNYANIEDKQKAFEIFMNHYKNNLCNETYLYPNVKETLQNLKHHKLAIVSNKPEPFIKPILKKLDIDVFDFIAGAETFEEKKPSPLPLLKTCEILNEKPENAVMIGDSKNDLISAKKANIKSIAVNYGYNYGEGIEKYEPHFIVNDLKEIVKVINEL